MAPQSQAITADEARARLDEMIKDTEFRTTLALYLFDTVIMRDEASRRAISDYLVKTGRV